MSSGRKPLLNTLDPARKAAVDAAIDGQRHKSARALHIEFGLESTVSLRAFRRYVAERRDDGSAAGANAPAAEPASPGEIRLRIVALIQARIETGDVPDYLLPKFLDAIVGLDVEKRAAEKHEAWRTEVTARLKTATDEKSEGGKTLTREDVYDLVDQVMRGKV